MHHYDKDIDGCVDINEFMTAIRGVPNEIRINIIDQAFEKFDLDNSGYVDVRDLK